MQEILCGPHKIPSLIAALTRGHDGWEQAAGLITAGVRSSAGKALDEVSAAIPRDAVARNK